jgi:hypothetical protein
MLQRCSPIAVAWVGFACRKTHLAKSDSQPQIKAILAKSDSQPQIKAILEKGRKNTIRPDYRLISP